MIVPIPINPDEMEGLLVALQQPGALLEACVLAVCGAVAWLVTRAFRGAGADDDSIWFGRRLYDGVLFPVLLLVLAATARVLMTGFAKPAVFKLAIPVLVSLVLVRVTVHVLRASFPDSQLMRTIERSFSWAAWLAAVLWVTGVLPLMLDAMEGVSWTMGNHPITLRRFVEGLVMAGLVMVLALWVSAGVEKKLLRGTGSDLSLQKMAANLVRMLLLFVGLLLALSSVGIDLTALSVFGGAIGVGWASVCKRSRPTTSAAS
jgi:small-conductance mechanosensitive channel